MPGTKSTICDIRHTFPALPSIISTMFPAELTLQLIVEHVGQQECKGLLIEFGEHAVSTLSRQFPKIDRALCVQSSRTHMDCVTVWSRTAYRIKTCATHLPPLLSPVQQRCSLPRQRVPSYAPLTLPSASRCHLLPR